VESTRFIVRAGRDSLHNDDEPTSVD